MSIKSTPLIKPIVYPDSDGKPMADNTLQFKWIQTLQGNFDLLFAKEKDVFVAGDLLWYPAEGNPKERLAPDVLIAFGREKGYRGSYKQWLEGGVAPQVVMEVLSPKNTKREMKGKLAFYDRHGVREYYVFDPYDTKLTVYLRDANGDLLPHEDVEQFTSPLLGVRFDLSGSEMVVYAPNGEPFEHFVEIGEQRQQAVARAEIAETVADAALQRAEAATQRAERLAARLRELGVELPPE